MNLKLPCCDYFLIDLLAILRCCHVAQTAFRKLPDIAFLSFINKNDPLPYLLIFSAKKCMFNSFVTFLTLQAILGEFPISNRPYQLSIQAR